MDSCQDEIGEMEKYNLVFLIFHQRIALLTYSRQIIKWNSKLISFLIVRDIPKDGILVKINSGMTKQKLGINSNAIN